MISVLDRSFEIGFDVYFGNKNSSALGQKFLPVFFTPKGCIMRAHGNARGKKIRPFSRPERANYRAENAAPSGRETGTGLSPRALLCDSSLS